VAARLADLADQQSGWPDGPPTRFFCVHVGTRVQEVPKGKVAVVGGHSVPVWGRLLRDFLPTLHVIEIPLDRAPSEGFLELAAGAPLDVVLDVSDDAATQQDAFWWTMRHLRPGGHYLARLLPGSDDLWALLTRAQDARVRDFPNGNTTDEAWLVRCLRSIEVRRRVLDLVPEKPGRAKLREEEVDAFLERRPDLGAVIGGHASATWTSRGQYDDNAQAQDPFLIDQFVAPPVRLRRYDGATATPKQVLTGETVVFPDTFRYNTMDRLVNIYLDDYAPRFANPHMSQDGRTDLPGAWFYLDSEAPGAFGHFITEQLPRLWAWEAAREREPGIRVLLSLTRDRHGRLADFELDMLGSFGITVDDVLVIDRPMRVERLYAATPMYSYPDRGLDEGGVPYIHPDLADVWRRIGEHLGAMAALKDRPARIFCSRRPGGRRSCRNGAEVEAFFERHGFVVVYPEDHAMPEQLALFRAAEVVAGFAGSAMFTLALCPSPTRVITLAPDAYTGRNEYGIAALWGHRLTTVWSSSEISHPAGSWTREAFWAPFTFDFAQEGRYLEGVLSGLDQEGRNPRSS
jgi:capsular polysaccharide biosynthesis protein